MRSFIKIFLIAITVLSGSVLLAQDKNKTLLQTEKMAQALELSDKQKAALDKELKATQAEKKAAMEKARAIREEMKRDAFVARQERENKLKEILTEEQWTKYKTLEKKNTRGRKGNFQRSRDGKGQRVQGNFRRRGRLGQDRGQARDTVSRRRMVMGKRGQVAKKKKELEEKEEGGGGN